MAHHTLSWAAALLRGIRHTREHVDWRHTCTFSQAALSSPQCLQPPCQGGLPTALAGAEHGVAMKMAPANQHVHAKQQDAGHLASSLQAEVHCRSAHCSTSLRCVRQGKALTSKWLHHDLQRQQSEHEGGSVKASMCMLLASAGSTAVPADQQMQLARQPPTCTSSCTR